MKPTVVINIQTIEQGFTGVKILELFGLHFVIIGILGFHLRDYLFFSKTFFGYWKEFLKSLFH